MASVFLTGGSGYLGGRLLAGLSERGEEVVALSRNPEALDLGFRGVRPRRGDVRDLDSLRRGMEGCDRVFHVAAQVRMWDPTPGSFEAVNVEGLRNVLRAAGERGISRMVYTSSFIALGPTDGTVADEDWHVPRRRFHNEYERTKSAADAVAREAAIGGAPLVILYPGVIYGPGKATEGNLIGATLRDHVRGRLPGLLGKGDRRFCYAYIADVVQGHLSALEKAADGERYILGGENRTMKELFDLLETLTGRAAPRREIPYWAATAAGRLQRWRAAWLGVTPQITDEVIEIYRHEWAFSSAKATQRLGYVVTPLAEGLRETLRGLEKGTP